MPAGAPIDAWLIARRTGCALWLSTPPDTHNAQPARRADGVNDDMKTTAHS